MFATISGWKNNQKILLAVLFILSFAVYANTYRNQFTYDDVLVMTEDHRVRTLRSLPEIFTRDYLMIPDHNLYRPLPLFTIAFNYLIFGQSPWSYRLINQLLHCMNVVLLFFFLGNFYKDRPSFRFVASAIFAVHPAATEAVNLVVYRAELLAFTFSILAFHLYIKRKEKPYYPYCSVALYFLAMLSKESAMILPLFLLLYHLYFQSGRARDFLRDMPGYAAAAILVSGIRYAVLGAFGPQNIQQFFYGISWLPTFFTMVKALAYYGKIVFWPAHLQMNYDFSDFPVAYSLFDPWVLISLVAVLAVPALAWWVFNKDRRLSFFILWPVVALLPVTNFIVPTGVLIAVRLLYLPMIGCSVLLAAMLMHLTESFPAKYGYGAAQPRIRALMAGCIAMVLIVLASLTVNRNADFRDGKTLFKKDLALSPNNMLSIKFLAPELPADEADALLRRAVEINPTDTAVLMMLGQNYERRGEHAAAEAAEKLSLKIGPTPQAYKQLGIIYSNTGRLLEAEEQFRKVIELKPFWSNAYEDLAIVLLKEGQREAALAMAQKALSINPASAAAYNLIGTYYKQAGNFNEAVRAYQQAVALSPDFFEGMYNLADTYEKIDPAVAIEKWQEYLRAAQNAESEKPWIGNAKNRIASLTVQRIK